MNSKIEQSIMYLRTTGVVPLDTIYGLTAHGINFNDLDRKYNINN